VQIVRNGCAVGVLSAEGPAQRIVEPDDSLLALVRWRLADPTWKPSFRDLLDDVQTCIDPMAGAPLVLAALRDVVRSDVSLAQRARVLAVEAQQAIAGKAERFPARREPQPIKKALRLLRGFRQATAFRS
jgi:hypothetical protein